FVDNARGFVYLLRDHIYKENNILYPMADSRLTDEDQSKLEREFQRVNEESIGLEKIEYLLGLKDELKSVYLP
ncbi:MAG TPA: hemerythrin, partial [Candidatus Marinimicrobia bacterium]|nr:hemerythrin [Candidatus Neomarinimicrobiota bacterium]